MAYALPMPDVAPVTTAQRRKHNICVKTLGDQLCKNLSLLLFLNFTILTNDNEKLTFSLAAEFRELDGNIPSKRNVNDLSSPPSGRSLMCAPAAD